MKIRRRGRPDDGSPFQIYIRDIKRTSLLSAEQERALARLVAAGDRDARDQMIRANLLLVVGIARGFLGRGLGLEDLVAEGNIGLLRAVDRFDAGAGARFGTYAVHWIRDSIRRAVMDQGRPIRFPARMMNLLSKWRRATTTLAECLGRSPTPEEVGQALGISPRTTALVVGAVRVQELQSRAGSPNGEELPLEELLADEHSLAPDAALAESDDWEQLSSRLARLDGREAEIIRMRFGIGPYEPMTLREVGRRLGMTHEGARQLEARALQRLVSPGALGPARNGLAAAASDPSPSDGSPRRVGEVPRPAAPPIREADDRVGRDKPETPPLVPANQALLLRLGATGAGTSPARIVGIDRKCIHLACSLLPVRGERVGIRLMEPYPTEWVWATVAATRTTGDGPHRLDLEFPGVVPREIREALAVGLGPGAGAGAGAARAELASDLPGAIPRAPRRLLIVEDHELTRRALLRLFQHRGYEVASAATVAEGLAMLEPPPCCLVLDLMLPDGGGEAILRKVRSDNLPTRVAVCTGTEDSSRLDAVRGLRPQALLQKPFALDDLIRACSGATD